MTRLSRTAERQLPFAPRRPGNPAAGPPIAPRLAAAAGVLAVVVAALGGAWGFDALARGADDSALPATAPPQTVAAQPHAHSEQWKPLFNGRNLDGWTPKFRGCELGENYNDTFRVEDGVLKVCYDKYEKFDSRFGHLFYKDTFSHYRLRVEYRFVGQQCAGGPGWAFRNSGIMIHGQSAESMGKDQSFPVSIEVQLLGGGGSGQRPTANLCTPGTHVVLGGALFTPHCTNSRSKTYHGDQWVSVELVVRGNERIQHLIDGQVVLEYEKPQLDPNDADAKRLIEAGAERMLTGGTISLQAESHPCEFRKVEIMVLEP